MNSTVKNVPQQKKKWGKGLKKIDGKQFSGKKRFKYKIKYIE